MTFPKVEKGIQIHLDDLTNMYRNGGHLESIINDYHRLMSPHIADYLNDYKKLLGQNPHLDSVDAIERAIGFTSLQSVSEYLKPLEISATDAIYSKLYEEQLNHILGLDRTYNLSQVFNNMTGLHGAEAVGYYKSLLQNTIGFSKCDEVLLLNQRLSVVTGLEHVSSTSSVVKKYVLDMCNQLSTSVNSTLPSDVDEILKRDALGINDLFSSLTVYSAVESARKLLGIHSDSHSLLFDQFRGVLSDKVLSSSVLAMAGIESDYVTKIMGASGLGSFSSIEEMIRQSTLDAIDWFEPYINDFSTVIDIDALTEIKNSLQYSNEKASFQFYLSLLLSILMFLYSIHSSFESDKKNLQLNKELNANIDSLETTVAAQFFIIKKQLSGIDKYVHEIQSSNPNDAVEYIVVRPVELRTKNNSSEDSHVICILQPNQKVELLKRNGKWIYVGFFDYVEGIPKTGWVRKKYLKMI